MSKRLASVELELFGVSRMFEFDPPVLVQGEDEMEVGMEVLDEVCSYEVTLVPGGATRARVYVAFTIQGGCEVEIDSDDDTWENMDDVRQAAEEDYETEKCIRFAATEANFEVDDVEVLTLWNEAGDEVELDD